MSMFNQFHQKKKRAVNPDAPPRPNLLSHDVTIKDLSSKLSQALTTQDSQRSEIDRLNKKVRGLEQTVNQLINVLRK